MRKLSEDQMRGVLRAHIAPFESNLQAAKTLGVSTTFLSEALHGTRKIGPTICSQLGYRQVKEVHYVKE